MIKMLNKRDFGSMLSFVLLFCLIANDVACQDSRVYFERLIEHEAIDRDWSLEQHWDCFCYLCRQLTFDRDAVHFIPMLWISPQQQHALMWRIRHAGWNVSLALVHIIRARKYGQWRGDRCECLVEATDDPEDNSGTYRYCLTYGSSETKVIKDIIVPASQTCDCGTEDLPPLSVLRLDVANSRRSK